MSQQLTTVPVRAEVIEHPAPASNPLDLPQEVFSAGLSRRKSNRAELMNWVREALVEGVDYGRIHIMKKDKCSKGKYCTNPHHFSKPSLFKPGAEKICGMLGVTSSFPSLSEYEQAVLGGVSLQQIIIRCEITDASGKVVADGVGGRNIKQDYGDINKALKMAEKSAHIDATLRMAGLSEVFTQDIEDMINVENTPKPPNTQGNPLQGQKDRTDQTASTETQPAKAINEREHLLLESLIENFGLERKRVTAWVTKATAHHAGGAVTTLENLPQHLFQPLLNRLDQWSTAQNAVGAVKQ